MDTNYLNYCRTIPPRIVVEGHSPAVGDYYLLGDRVFAWDGRASLLDTTWIPDLDALTEMICSELSPNRAIPVKWGTAIHRLSVWMTEQNAASLLASCMQEVLLRYLVRLRASAILETPKKKLRQK